jgi:hypothetical protein
MMRLTRNKIPLIAMIVVLLGWAGSRKRKLKGGIWGKLMGRNREMLKLRLVRLSLTCTIQD